MKMKRDLPNYDSIVCRSKSGRLYPVRMERATHRQKQEVWRNFRASHAHCLNAQHCRVRNHS